MGCKCRIATGSMSLWTHSIVSAMSRGRRRIRLSATLFVGLVGLMLSGCGGDGAATPVQTFPGVAKATCTDSGRGETALQGQVPPPLRRPNAFSGFHCNLELLAQIRGEGAGWQSAFFTDTAGHLCSYYDTAPPTPNRVHPGVVVVDATDPQKPAVTTYLSAPALLDPLESLKVNQQRGLLAAVQSLNEEGGPKLDVYDVSDDCRSPRLLSPTPGKIDSPARGKAVERANEGDFAPDGLTYYATNLRAGNVYPIDLTDPRHPKLLAKWSMPSNQRTSGLAISGDGNRAYFTLYGDGAASGNAAVTGLTNGLVIADVSEVQARKPHPQVKVVGAVVWGDGSASHQIIPIRIAGKPFLVATDEGGSGDSNASGWKAACGAGLPAWSMARIVDIANEAHPRVTAQLKLEVNDPKNCDEVLPDLAGLSGFTYGSHYCSVDEPSNATTLACGYFESGIRVFDIRDPSRPREIAYFVPPSVTTPSPGSLNNATVAKGRPDHCSAQAHFDVKSSTLITTCQDNGFLALKFPNGVWPITKQ